MQRMHHRVLPTLVTAVAALSLGAAPALAGSDGCVGGDCQDQNTPVQALPQTAVPVAPAPAPESGGTSPEQTWRSPSSTTSSSSPRTWSKNKTKVKTRTRAVATRTVAFKTTAQGTVPSGGVAAGAGGTAPQAPDVPLLGLIGGGLLVLMGGGMVATGRRGA